MATKTSALEIQTCSRCHGSGNYSYNQIDGSRCFKCAGSGVVHTKRGAAAYLFLKNIRSVPVNTLKVGDTFRFDDLGRSFFVTIESIETKTMNYITNGEAKSHEAVEVTGKRNGERFSTITGADFMVRKGWSVEEKAAQLALAIEYQATLTEQGKPRKR